MRERNEPDNFLDGLSLGYWDEEFGYYKPKTPTVVEVGVESPSEATNNESTFIIPQLGETALLLGLDIQWGEPEITTDKDMKSGDW